MLAHHRRRPHRHLDRHLYRPQLAARPAIAGDVHGPGSSVAVRSSAVRVDRPAELGPDGPWRRRVRMGCSRASASRHQARQAKLATQGMIWLDATSQMGTTGTEATRSTCQRAPLGEPPSPVCPQRPLRRLTSIRDGTAHGGSDSFVDPTMALGPISRRSAAFQLAQDGQTCRLTVVPESAQGRPGLAATARSAGGGSSHKNAYQWAD